jgi:hypothetical protein
MTTAIGAYCRVTYKDEPWNVRHVFISFAEDCGEAECDAFGTPDERIFFFCPNGEEELKELMNGKSKEDFHVHGYSVHYRVDD